MIQAGLLAWILPGLGHWRLGQRGLAAIFFLAISFPYFTGLAFGGIKNCVNPYSNKYLFLAEMGAGGYTTLFWIVNRTVGDLKPEDLRTAQYFEQKLKAAPPEQRERWIGYVSYFPESDVAQIYLATAGLLNLLAIFDALSRAQTGLPTFHRELARAPASEGGA